MSSIIWMPQNVLQLNESKLEIVIIIFYDLDFIYFVNIFFYLLLQFYPYFTVKHVAVCSMYL